MLKMTLGLALSASLSLCAAQASALDTSKPLLCAVTQVQECIDGSDCETVLPEEVNAPTFIRVDMKKKQIHSRKAGRPTRIELHEAVKGRLVLMGADQGNDNQPDGGGWVMSIEEDTGRFAGTMVLRQTAINIFGACTEPFFE